MRKLEPEFLEDERALARAVVADDAAEVHAILGRLGYRRTDDFVPEALLEWLLAPASGTCSPAAPALAAVRDRAARRHRLPALALVRAAAAA